MQDQRIYVRLVRRNVCKYKVVGCSFFVALHKPVQLGHIQPQQKNLLRRQLHQQFLRVGGQRLPVLAAAVWAGVRVHFPRPLRVRRRSVQCRFLQAHSVLVLRLPAHGADLPAAALVVVQVLQHNVVDPAEQANTAVVLPVVHDILCHGGVLVALALPRGRFVFRLFLGFQFHVHTIPALDVPLGLRDLQENVIHVLNAREYARLRDHQLWVHGRYHHVTHGARPFHCLVPLHQIQPAALDGYRPLHKVVDFFKRHPLQFVAQHCLDLHGQLLVLLPPRHHLGLRDIGVHHGLDVLIADIPDMGRSKRLLAALLYVVGRQWP